MTFSKEQVEWIVQEVIRRLRAMDGVAAAGERSCVAAEGHELRIVERTVTLRSLDGRLANISRVVVQQRAVVTPAVKDELKKRKIELLRQG